MRKRNLNLDVIRCVALLFVLCVHFFLHAGFYNYPLTGTDMFIGLTMRNIFTSCVPLFIMLTGYLMNKKTISIAYFKGIKKVVLLYLISCIPLWIFRIYYLGEPFSIKSIIKSVLSCDGYSWYVAMYLGLYLLIPFLNLIYNNLETKKHKQILILILSVLTAFPSVTNLVGFNVITDFWLDVYPITYYFIGAYLNEYADSINLSAWKLFLLYAATHLAGGTFSYVFANNRYYYESNVFTDWGNLLTTITTTVLFLGLLKCDFSKTPKFISASISFVSLISLQLYLVSLISDSIVYNIFNMYYVYFSEKLIRFLIPVLISFLISFVIATIVHFIYTFITKISAR